MAEGFKLKKNTSSSDANNGKSQKRGFFLTNSFGLGSLSAYCLRGFSYFVFVCSKDKSIIQIILPVIPFVARRICFALIINEFETWLYL